jgi:hypothetical protein
MSTSTPEEEEAASGTNLPRRVGETESHTEKISYDFKDRQRGETEPLTYGGARCRRPEVAKIAREGRRVRSDGGGGTRGKKEYSHGRRRREQKSKEKGQSHSHRGHRLTGEVRVTARRARQRGECGVRRRRGGWGWGGESERSPPHRIAGEVT